METVTRSEQETESFGEKLATSLRRSEVIYLIGELGSGKTCLARGLARGLGASEREVASPTFAILHEYVGTGGAVVLRHLDLYRLADQPRDLDILGLPDSVGGAPVAVEWPGQAIQRILPPTTRITIEVQPDGARAIRIDGGQLKAES